MSMKSASAAVISACLLAFASLSANAAPVKLFTYEASAAGSLNQVHDSATSGGMIFFLTYGHPLGPPQLTVGDHSQAFFTGQTGSIDFNATNSADFTALTNAVTQGGMDLGSRFRLLLNGDPNRTGIGSGACCGDNFGLYGSQIDF